MNNDWDRLLNILNLTKESRQKARLELIISNPNCEPTIEVLEELRSFIEKEFSTSPNSCYVAWFKRSETNPDESYLMKKNITFSKIPKLQSLWNKLMGEYMIFFPDRNKRLDSSLGDEEEIIGEILTTYDKCFIKAPDGNVILHLYMQH
ncbi:hypothetical protein SAMN04487936_103372 [Halobacillus dabanensis]|uniref:Uncharacterized protein n=1 Tax=Halobacillus dabanensis TaxID=240302 RepID=A0A1I3TK75_HALDA|nr:hypothetical protein [Halobacillus dabanensis]SFJ69917.1 hypothetical protein SAMN04487936_103372 [Halobacillus dabanensis]